jgi:hypothetical protein
MKPISAAIEMGAPADFIYQIVTDFDRYGEWNSFTPRITLTNAAVQFGAEFDLDCQMTPTHLLKNEHEMILALDPEHLRFCMGTSRTRGRPGITSYRWQICTPLAEALTRLVNYEQFFGPISPIVYLLYRAKLAAAFDRYCAEVKARAESLYAAGTRGH